MSKKYDCPQCGQDTRLPANAWAVLKNVDKNLQKMLRTVDEYVRLLTK